MNNQLEHLLPVFKYAKHHTHGCIIRLKNKRIELRLTHDEYIVYVTRYCKVESERERKLMEAEGIKIKRNCVIYHKFYLSDETISAMALALFIYKNKFEKSINFVKPTMADAFKIKAGSKLTMANEVRNFKEECTGKKGEIVTVKEVLISKPHISPVTGKLTQSVITGIVLEEYPDNVYSISHFVEKINYIVENEQ